MSHFDVNIQYTAGKIIPLTDYLSRHPIIKTAENGTENDVSGQTETESEEEFVMNQIHSLFHFIQMNGSIKRFTKRIKPRPKIDQPSDIRKREQNKQNHSLEASVPLNGVNPTSIRLLNRNQSAPETKMDKVNGIDLQFIYKKRGHSPETYRLWTERKNS